MEINHFKTILRKNNFIDSCIKSFLNKLYSPKVSVENVPRRDASVRLPFLGSTSIQIVKKPQTLCTDKLMSCNLKIFLSHLLKSKTFFTFKDKLPKTFQDLFTSTSEVAAVLPITVRTNAILKSEFVNIYAFYISLEKKVKIDSNKLTAI